MLWMELWALCSTRRGPGRRKCKELSKESPRPGRWQLAEGWHWPILPTLDRLVACVLGPPKGLARRTSSLHLMWVSAWVQVPRFQLTSMHQVLCPDPTHHSLRHCCLHMMVGIRHQTPEVPFHEGLAVVAKHYQPKTVQDASWLMSWLTLWLNRGLT